MSVRGRVLVRNRKRPSRLRKWRDDICPSGQSALRTRKTVGLRLAAALAEAVRSGGQGYRTVNATDFDRSLYVKSSTFTYAP